MSIYQFSTEAGTEYILMPASVRLYLYPVFFAILHLPLTKGRKTGSGWHPLIVPQCRCFPKLSHTAGSPPQVWWVTVRKYHYRPEKIVAHCPATDSSMRCVYRSFPSSRRRMPAPSPGELYLLSGYSSVKVRLLHHCTFSTLVPKRRLPHSGHFCFRNRGAVYVKRFQRLKPQYTMNLSAYIFA